MKFAIQYNLMNEEQLQAVKTAVDGYPHQYINVVPFDHVMISNDPIDGTDYIPYGSTLMTNLAKQLEWSGLHFDVDKLNYRNFLQNRTDMLNDNVMSCTDAIAYLKTLDPDKEVFSRPSKDLKQYSGMVIEAGELASWIQSMNDSVGGGSYYMDPKEDVVISTPKDISAEWRYFIVGGKIVSGSMYRAHGQMRKLQELDATVLKEAQDMADIWLPMDCVVMDTCLVDGIMKVVEFNTINSSGFYANDVNAIFKALWEYHE